MSIPTFALMLTRLDGWYQSQVWEGANAAADLLEVRIVGLVGSPLGDLHGDGGSSEIYRVASSECFDGYLPLVGSLANANGIGIVERLFAALPPRPTVCVGVELKNFAAVIPSKGGIDQVVEHLVWHHGLKRIAYLSGPLVNPDAQTRLDLFRRTMSACGLEFPLDWMDQGGFTKDKGEAATERLLQRIGIPQAIVCANDAMAFGAQQALSRRGLKVPQDVVLTGYDDIEEARIQVPPLTTVSAHPFQVSFRAVEKLVDFHRSGAIPRSETIPSAMVLRPSCGCPGRIRGQELPEAFVQRVNVPSVEALRERLSSRGIGNLWEDLQSMDLRQLDLWERTIQKASESLSTQPADGQANLLVSEFLAAGHIASRARATYGTRRQFELHQVLRDQYTVTQELMANLDPEGFADRLQKGIQVWQSRRMRLLLFRSDLSPVVKPDFSHDASFELAIDSCEGVRHLDRPERLLPTDDPTREGWTILSLSMREEHYGLVQLRGWTTNQLFMESIRLMLVTVLSSAYRFRLERGMHERLLQLSQRDELTGLFNRRGLLDHGGILVHKALSEGQRIGVVLCDLDGLKTINDLYGHFDGDLAIRAMAISLEDVFRPADVIARMGGDEFAVLAMLPDDADLDGAMRRLRQALAHRSGQMGRPWEARTSAGWMSWDPRDGSSLEEALVRADQSLYQDKGKRKRGGETTFGPS
ncbi:MAG: GGDEF domain-containing protein [Fibrobacteres bacterium]|jgi:diguanylate cyclase (GGDEF)-like protein|nr:GGDEF domain-containing protein [Fibrobacterota bacterium]